MQATEMNFLEIADFTGLEVRKPTAEEIDLVLSQAAIVEMQRRQTEGEIIKSDDLSKEIDKYLKEEKSEIEFTSRVFDFKSVGKRLFCYYSMGLHLQDHAAQIQSVMGSVIMVPEMESLRRAATPHNHLTISYQFVLIDANNKISPYRYGVNDICLHKTEKDIKEL